MLPGQLTHNLKRLIIDMDEGPAGIRPAFWACMKELTTLQLSRCAILPPSLVLRELTITSKLGEDHPGSQVAGTLRSHLSSAHQPHLLEKEELAAVLVIQRPAMSRDWTLRLSTCLKRKFGSDRSGGRIGYEGGHGSRKTNAVDASVPGVSDGCPTALVILSTVDVNCFRS